MMNFAVYTVFAVTLQFGSYLIISSQGTLLNVGQLSALTTYGFMILMALMMVSMVFAMITMAQESAERICEVLTTEPTIKNPAHPETEMRDGSIDFDDVTFKYSEPRRRSTARWPRSTCTSRAARPSASWVARARPRPRS